MAEQCVCVLMVLFLLSVLLVIRVRNVCVDGSAARGSLLNCPSLPTHLFSWD